MQKFEWADGYRAKVSAEVAGAVLEPLLEKENQALVPKKVVDIARNPNSPIHAAFEWDDSVAAEEYRLDQARKMLHSLKIHVQRVTNTTEPIRFFVNVKSPEATPRLPVRHYTSLDHAMKNPTLRAQVLANAFKDLDSFRRKYAQFEELARVHEEIDRLLAEAEKSIAV